LKISHAAEKASADLWARRTTYSTFSLKKKRVRKVSDGGERELWYSKTCKSTTLLVNSLSNKETRGTCSKKGKKATRRGRERGGTISRPYCPCLIAHPRVFVLSKGASKHNLISGEPRKGYRAWGNTPLFRLEGKAVGPKQETGIKAQRRGVGDKDELMKRLFIWGKKRWERDLYRKTRRI